MLTPEWKYEFYNDSEVIKFFIDNPIPELPNVVKKFNSFNLGAHKADLFRYYYLYLRGGFFMDSDAMIYKNIEEIVKDYAFVSVNNSRLAGAIFQGVIGASPKNEIIKEALFHLYNANMNFDIESNYLCFCHELYNILTRNNFDYKIKLYEERHGRQGRHCGIAEVWDENEFLFAHYFIEKIIPNTL